MFGPVITAIHDFDRFQSFFEDNKMNAVKVVTAWNPLHQARLYGLTNNVIIRTSCGDPSYKRANPYLDVNDVRAEIKPYYHNKRDIYVQLGNEPNIDAIDPYVYWWYYIQAAQMLRKEMPKARIIFTPLQLNGSENRWLQIFHEQLSRNYEGSRHLWDIVGWHIYAHHSIVGERRDLDCALKLHHAHFPESRAAVMECGINDASVKNRLQEYRSLLEFFDIVVYFHYSDDKKIFSNYCIP